MLIISKDFEKNDEILISFYGPIKNGKSQQISIKTKK